MRRLFFAIIAAAFLAPSALAQTAALETMAPSEWLKGLAAVEKQSRSVRSLSDDGQFVLLLKASTLAGFASRLAPAPRDELATMHCAMAAQALRNYIDDVRKGTAKGDGLAETDMVDYREFKPKCLKAMRR